MTGSESGCAVCGGPIEARAEGASLMVSCRRCGWRAITSNPDIPPHDPGRYTVAVCSPHPASATAAKLAVALGVPARQLLPVALQQCPLVHDVEAIEVLRLARLVAPLGIGLEIEPPFPWPLPTPGGP